MFETLHHFFVNIPEIVNMLWKNALQLSETTGCPKKNFPSEFESTNSGQIWAFWAILGTLVNSGHFSCRSGYFGQFLALLGILGNSGHFWAPWAILGTFGHFGQFCALFWHFGKFWALWAILGTLGKYLSKESISKVHNTLIIQHQNLTNQSHLPLTSSYNDSSKNLNYWNF